MIKPLGESKVSPRGFEYIKFNDHYDEACSLQQSSLAGDENHLPGTSAVWLGCDHFRRHHVTGDLNGRMHLNRDQVAALIQHLQRWLDHGTFQLPEGRAPAPSQGETSSNN